MPSVLAVVLSGATTSEAKAQLTVEGERSLREGMLVVVESGGERILARVDEIRPYSSFYVEGDAWTEARRRGLKLPAAEAAATRYMVATLTLLGSATGRGLVEPSRPPMPGDKVVPLGEGGLLRLLGLRVDEPGVVVYGRLLGYSHGVPLSVENITMHLGVFGETGSGKSYGVGYLLELLGDIPVGGGERAALPALVVDANGDYLDYYQVYASGGRVARYGFVRRLVFPRSPARYGAYAEPVTIDIDVFTARELAEFIASYRLGGVAAAELQVSGLERLLSRFEGVYSFTELFTERFGELLQELESMSRGRDAVIHPQTARAVRHALDRFRRDLVEQHGLLSRRPSLGTALIEELVEKQGLAILDFSPEGAPGVPLPLRQLVVAYLLRLLYKLFTQYKVSGRERYLLLVIEEAQNYAPNPKTYPVAWSIARDYLALIATQGRKFGICLALVSQRPSYIDPVVAAMLNTWIVYRLPPDDVHAASRAAGGLPPQVERRLTRLPRGVALIHGQMNMLGFPVLVETGRRRAPHTMGRTRLVEALRVARRGGSRGEARGEGGGEAEVEG